MNNKIVFGEIDWNSKLESSSSNYDFMRVMEGENIVRIVAKPIQFYIHWVETKDGSKAKVISPNDNQSLVEKLSENGYARKPRWLLKVLDRSDESFKYLEIGSQIFNGIKGLFNHPKWGSPLRYDISINRASPGTQPLYTVTPNPKEDLSDNLKNDLSKFLDNSDVSSFITPFTSNKVNDIMGWANEIEDDDFEFSFDD